MKGCLGLIIKIIILVLIFFGLLHLGVIDFIKTKWNINMKPSQEKMIEKSKSIADLSGLNEEYSIKKSINILDYHVIIAEHNSSGQKFAIISPKNNETLTQEDFETNAVEDKIKTLNEKFQYQIVRLENLKMTKKDKIKIQGQTIPYAKFEADVVNLPISRATGIIAVAQNSQGKNIIIASVNETKKYSQIISDVFYEQLKLN